MGEVTVCGGCHVVAPLGAVSESWVPAVEVADHLQTYPGRPAGVMNARFPR